MIEGCEFLFQAMKGTVYHVSKKGVKAVDEWTSTNSIMAFVDLDKNNRDPDDMLVHDSVQLVVATSPKGVNRPWMRQSALFNSITRLIVQLWTDKELFLFGSVLALFSSLN
jgi:DNA polymerase sigma